MFISEPNKNSIAGVKRIFYSTPTPTPESVHQVARDFDLAARRAELVSAMGSNLKRLGFSPDIVIGHHGWGELLNIKDVWPDVPVLGYFEFYYETDGQDVDFDPEFPIAKEKYAKIRAMNVVNHLALAMRQHGQTPTVWQQTRYPEWARPQIRVIPEGAQLDICRPDPMAAKRPFSIGDFHVAPGEKLITYVARNLEPYRGFHVMMRALPEILRKRKDVKVVMVGGDDVSYGSRLSSGTWKEFFQTQMKGLYDDTRVLMPGQIPYEDYVRLLQRSDVHVYLTYPFVASWSLREALACGCAVIGSDVESVTEFLTHGKNGLLVPFLEPVKIAQAVLNLLEDTKLNKRLRQGARKYAEQHLDMKDYLSRMTTAIHEIVSR